MHTRTTWYILAPTLALSALLLAGGLSSAWYVHRANRDVSDALDQLLVATQSAERLVFTLRDVRWKLHHFANGDATQAADTLPQPSEVEQALQHLRLLRPVEPSWPPDMPARIAGFQQDWRRLMQAPEPLAAKELARDLEAGLLRPVETLLGSLHEQVTAASRENQVNAQRIGGGLLLLGICGSVAGVLIGFAMARSVHRSLLEISIPVQDIAGRLNQVVGPIKVSAHSNLASLDGALRTLADKTADVVQRLEESQREALRSEQLAAVGQLAAGLAHELRNPLMSVKLIVQAAGERGSGSLRPRDLTVIEDEVTRLERMLQTFLDFARPPQPAKQWLDARTLADNSLELVRTRAEQQDVCLEFDPPADEIKVPVDASQMRQVLLNVLINALDALPGGGHIRLELVEGSSLSLSQDHDLDADTPYPPTTGGVAIRITDDGAGIPESVMERIFEPFLSTKDTGIGLGLSISRRIVESHGGWIRARNRHPRGAEFTVWLPVGTSSSRSLPAALSSPT